jgi:hypothetical protein
MMKPLLLAVAAMALGATSANAAVITRSYTNVSTFAPGSGPLTNLTLNFTVTYDPASTAMSGPATLNAFSSSSSLGSFAGPNEAVISRQGGRSYLTVGGTTGFGAGSVTGFGDDFFTFFYFNPAGDVVSTDSNAVSYAVGYGSVLTRSITSVTTAAPAVAAVPEPATWMMMIGGFGLVGGAMRRKKVSVRFA